jgi:ankyrin repeat protein
MDTPTKPTNTNAGSVSDSVWNRKDDSKLPTEASREEYAELEAQITELSEDEAREEWMESCRYGEVDIVRALLSHFPSLITCVQADTGNTALHFAAANGHVEVAKLLLKQNHILTKNSEGNTPLHWAAERGQAEIVQILTANANQEIDVLQKNEFGRSALTEGFTSQNEFVVKSLLEHESASEEKLLSTDGKSVSEVTHEFFEKENPLLVRELAITNADDPFADTDKPDSDTTGLSIWAAALVLARWMRTKSWKDASVLELGAGCGVPGL